MSRRGQGIDESSHAGAGPAAGRGRPEGMPALRLMAALVEFAEDPVIGLTLDGLITAWNPAAERLYGYTEEEALGASITMLVPPERRGDGSPGLLATVREGEAVRQVETQPVAKDGRRIDVSISMAPIRDEAGVVVGAVAFTRDISFRAAAEERLRRSEAQLAEAQALASLGSWERDLTSGEVRWSPEFYRMLGRDPDELSATFEGFFQAIDPADRPLAAAAIQDALTSGRPLDYEYRIVLPGGAKHTIHARGHAVRDEAGRPIRLVGTAQDVTALAEARQRLEEANGRLEETSRRHATLLAAVADGIYGLDREGRVIFVNPAAVALTGYSEEQTLGRSPHEMVHHSGPDGSHHPPEECPCTAGLRGVTQTVSDEVFWRAGGTSFRVHVLRPAL